MMIPVDAMRFQNFCAGFSNRIAKVFIWNLIGKALIFISMDANINLRQQLAETTGIFKGKERKALEKQIQQTESELKENWINSPIF